MPPSRPHRSHLFRAAALQQDLQVTGAKLRPLVHAVDNRKLVRLNLWQLVRLVALCAGSDNGRSDVIHVFVYWYNVYLYKVLIVKRMMQCLLWFAERCRHSSAPFPKWVA